MEQYLNNFRLLLAKVHNPFSVIFDRLNLLKNPYEVRLKEGLKFEIRPNSGDRFGFYEVLLRGDYTNGSQQIMPGDTVIDIGANIGSFSLLASKKVGPSGRVIALEPEEANYRQLQRNIELNNATNIVPKRLAVGGMEGTVKLFSDSSSSLFSSIFDLVDDKNISIAVQKIQMTTLEKLMRVENIDTCNYLKLDCEGAEHDIISNLSAELSMRINQISMEVHEIENHDSSLIFSKLQDLDFSLVSKKFIYYFCR